MSYPWWQFEVTFSDGYTDQFQATGVDVADAMRELLDGFHSEALHSFLRDHRDVEKVVYKCCLTFGVDPQHEKEGDTMPPEREQHHEQEEERRDARRGERPGVGGHQAADGVVERVGCMLPLRPKDQGR